MNVSSVSRATIASRSPDSYARTNSETTASSEGEVGAGDAIELMSRDGHAVTVADVATLYRDGSDQVSLLRRAVQVEALPENWREHFQQQIAQLQGRPLVCYGPQHKFEKFGKSGQEICSLFPHLKDGAVLLVSSQLPVGTMAEIEKRFPQDGRRVAFAYSPENLRLGTAINVFRNAA